VLTDAETPHPLMTTLLLHAPAALYAKLLDAEVTAVANPFTYADTTVFVLPDPAAVLNICFAVEDSVKGTLFEI
jgi:hypothetical protein